MKVNILLIYSGTLPSYFPAFLKSCAWNPGIQWTLLLDREPAVELPPNVSVVEFSVADLVRRVSERLGVAANFADPYKLCDFRPALGAIYPEVVGGCDVWGHCDSDVIFGDLGRILPVTPSLMPPKLQMRGALSFYRNDDIGNNLFRLPHPRVNFREALAAPKYVMFDEWHGLWHLIKHNQVEYLLKDDEVAEINVDYHDLRLHFSRANRFPQAFVWDHGRLFRYFRDRGGVRRDEFAYIHLQKRAVAPPPALPDRFAITPGRISAMSSDDEIEAILRLNRPRPMKTLLMQFARLSRRWKARAKIDRRYMSIPRP